MKQTTFALDGHNITLESGRLANQADGAVVYTAGNTILLATVTMSDSPREGIDFFPLMVDFEGRYYATGRIKGSRFNKREGRAPDSYILYSRMVDRPLRPMFPKGMQNDVQIVITQLQSDGTRPLAADAITAASTAINLSGIPFEAPVAGVHVGMREDGSFFLNPTFDDIEHGKLDLVVAGTEDAVLMVESGSNLITNEEMIAALEFAHEHIKTLCREQKAFTDQFTPEEKVPSFAPTADAEIAAVDAVITEEELEGVSGETKAEVKKKLHAVEEKVLAHYAERIEAGELSKGKLKGQVEKRFAKTMRRKIFEAGQRIDGRGQDDIRPLHVEVGIFPHVHGAALFQRGETQAVSLCTIAGPGAAQLLDDPDRPEWKKYYIHHYNFPPYSVGEVKPMRGPGRREVGHGALAERALRPVIPTKEEGFPYTLRVASEIFACNGSSSMASVCGSTLTLMDAGVPIKAAIAGIAMGLVMNEETGDYRILTDIQGFEDFDGDMDFKVAGDENRITALQLDIKIKGLKLELLREALEKAQVARTTILGAMKDVLPAPRDEMHPEAPRVYSIKINPDFIAAVIGKGGETIQGICADYEVEIDIEDDGTVMISGKNQENADKAIKIIQGIAYEPEIGEVFQNAVVKKLVDFGAFVEFMPGKEALLHVSEVTGERIQDVYEYLHEGMHVNVRLVDMDASGKMRLSMVDVQQEPGFEFEGGVRPPDNGRPPRGGGHGGRRR